MRPATSASTAPRGTSLSKSNFGFMPATTVVAGINPKLLFDKLVPRGAVDADVAGRMHGWKCESATFRMNVALSELPKFTVLPKKGNHLTAGIIMAPSLDYMHRAWLDADRKSVV